MSIVGLARRKSGISRKSRVENGESGKTATGRPFVLPRFMIVWPATERMAVERRHYVWLLFTAVRAHTKEIAQPRTVQPTSNLEVFIADPLWCRRSMAIGSLK